MRPLMLLIAAASLAGCKPTEAPPPPPPSPDATVTKKIVLKDITTGEKPNASLKKGYLANWSYFGNERVVQYTTDGAGVVTKISFALADDWEGYKLREELEKKLTEENGRKVAFDCNNESKRLEQLDGMAVTATVCTIRSDTQTLTIKSVHPKYEGDAEKFPTLKAFYDAAEVVLEDTRLESGRIEAERVKFETETRQEAEKAKRDI